MNKIQQLEVELKAAKQEAQDLERVTRDTLREAGNAFLASKPYEYRTYPADDIPSYWAERNQLPIKAQLRVEQRISPKLVIDFCTAHNTEWNVVANALSRNHEPSKWVGMVYQLTEENILTHTGGGTMILKDPMLCTDAEWASLEAGSIPQKYLRNPGAAS